LPTRRPALALTSTRRHDCCAILPLREIRYLDKLIDELAKGKAMEKILRG